jgi:hypothetical protein
MTKAEYRSFEDLALIGNRRNTARLAVQYAADASSATSRGQVVYQAPPVQEYIKREVKAVYSDSNTNPLMSQNVVPTPAPATTSEAVSNAYIPNENVNSDPGQQYVAPVSVTGNYPAAAERTNDPDLIRQEFADVLKDLNSGAK